MSLFPEIGPGSGAGSARPTGIRTTSVNTTVLPTDLLLLVTTGAGTISATLQSAAAAGPGRTVSLKKVDAGTGSCHFVRAGTDTIDGGISSVFALGNGASVTLVGDGVSSWRTVPQVAQLDTQVSDIFPIGPAAAGANGAAADSGHQHPTLNYVSKLGADVTVTTANTFQALLTLSPGLAGTYLISAQINASLPATAGAYAQGKIRLTSQAIDVASGETESSAALAETKTFPVASGVIVTLNASDTIQLLFAGSATTVTAKAALHVNGVGNNATQLSAVQIG